MSFDYDLSPFIPFRDAEACKRVRAIKKADIAKHSNPDFKIRVIEDETEFYFAFALDIVGRMKKTLEEGKKLVMILPVGPVPQYDIMARIVNTTRLSMKHVVTFNMDEYADEQGRTAPTDWEGSFQKAMFENFFQKIDEDLRPSGKNIHFPTDKNIGDYQKMIMEATDGKGADVCYGGIGWCGHIAFWEAHLGKEFGDDIQAYKKADARIVDLHPMTIMQNALHSFGGDWSWVPPKAASIGPREILGARHRSFWLDGDQGGGVSWQRFIARLVAHGPVNTLVPGSILQETRCDYHVMGGVADDVKIDFS
jgi:glucosamine-6-phosphate deaminase